MCASIDDSDVSVYRERGLWRVCVPRERALTCMCASRESKEGSDVSEYLLVAGNGLRWLSLESHIGWLGGLVPVPGSLTSRQVNCRHQCLMLTLRSNESNDAGVLNNNTNDRPTSHLCTKPGHQGLD